MRNKALAARCRAWVAALGVIGVVFATSCGSQEAPLAVGSTASTGRSSSALSQPGTLHAPAGLDLADVQATPDLTFSICVADPHDRSVFLELQEALNDPVGTAGEVRLPPGVEGISNSGDRFVVRVSATMTPDQFSALLERVAVSKGVDRLTAGSSCR
jgi:hypothetical protein